MRVVLYDDETMEPLTVLHLQGWMTSRLRHGERMVLDAHQPIKPFGDYSGPIDAPLDNRVSLWFEKFIRHEQEHWFCFTRDSDNALSLKSVFLPGQWPAVHDEYRRGVSEGIGRALTAMLRK